MGQFLPHIKDVFEEIRKYKTELEKRNSGKPQRDYSRGVSERGYKK